MSLGHISAMCAFVVLLTAATFPVSGLNSDANGMHHIISYILINYHIKRKDLTWCNCNALLDNYDGLKHKTKN